MLDSIQGVLLMFIMVGRPERLQARGILGTLSRMEAAGVDKELIVLRSQHEKQPFLIFCL